MEKVIYNGRSMIYYAKGDEVYSVLDNIPRIVESVDLGRMKVICTDGAMLPLSEETRATEETINSAKILDKRGKSTREVQKDILYFAKTKPSAILPTKKDEDSCYDLYACFEQEYIEILPHSIVMVGTGIATSFNKKYKAIVYERGSSGSIGLGVNCGVIDSGFRNEWFIALNNTTEKTIIITKKTDKIAVYADRIAYPYTKAIAQFALEIVPNVQTKELSWDELKEIKSERGLQKLGSSGK